MNRIKERNKDSAVAALFSHGGLCEIEGGYLVWLWLREEKSAWLALGGALLLTVYGFVATLQQTTIVRQ